MRVTITPTSSNTPTPSITASNTPTNTPSDTSCPDLTPTSTPSNTPTNTLTASPTMTQTMTQTPTGTSPGPCLCDDLEFYVQIAGTFYFEDCECNFRYEPFREGDLICICNKDYLPFSNDGGYGFLTGGNCKCIPFTPSPTPNVTSTPTQTPSSTPVSSPTNTPSFTPTRTVTPTKTKTPTPTQTKTPTPTRVLYYASVREVLDCTGGNTGGPQYIVSSTSPVSVGDYVTLNTLPSSNCAWRVMALIAGTPQDTINTNCGPGLPVPCCC